jgi:chromosome segregation ATPase
MDAPKPTPHTFRETDVTLRDYAELLVGGSDKNLTGLAGLFDQKLNGLKELSVAELRAIKAILDERDKLYKERDDSRRTAVDAALAAVKEQTKSSFEASEKAIVKAEEAQKSYNTSHNDLSRKMDEQYKAMTPQSEARLKWDNTDKELMEVRKDVISTRESAQKEITNLRDSLMREIAGLRESRSESVGGRQQQQDLRAWLVAGIAVIGLLVTLLSRIGVTQPPVYTPAPPGTTLPSVPPQPVPR